MVSPIAFIAQQRHCIVKKDLRKTVIYKLITYHVSEETNSVAVYLWPVSAAFLEA